MKKQNKGITLVALVITIIILLILAGISIATLTGSGLFEKAKLAEQKAKEAQEKEQEILSNIEEYLNNLGTTPPPIPSTPSIPPVEYAPYDSPYMPTGFKYKEGSWNNGYTIIGETESIGNEFVWVPCVLDQSKVKPGDTVVNLKKITTGEYNGGNAFELLPANPNVPAEDSSVIEIEESVGKYGGFYIAKYEAGIEAEKDNYSLSTKTVTNGSVKPLSQAEKGVWNYIAISDAIRVSKAMIDNSTTGVKSTLISGAAWDTTLQWIVNASDNKDNEPNIGYDINSTGKGWIKDVSNGGRHLTGYYAVNNIYDMAGNISECTTENAIYNGSSCVIIRGGDFYRTGTDFPTASRNNTTGSAGVDAGFRVVMYK